jgi:transcriptional regulator with XRE-family HTH domain
LDLGELGQTVRQARKEKGLTQRELAIRAGIHPITVSNLERGRVSDIGFRKLDLILEQLGFQFVIRPITAGRTLDDLERERLQERSAQPQSTVSKLPRLEPSDD